MEEENQIKKNETPKNKWLYTNDSFGKLENGLVLEDKTYRSGIMETEKRIQNSY